MNRNWNIGFEWVVTGAAILGVIVLLVTGEDGGRGAQSQPALSSSSGTH